MQNVIAIIDVGKTNKKLLVFDEAYQLVFEQSSRIAEIVDEDGFPCEDIHALASFVQQTLQSFLQNSSFCLKALNFTTYGASFVYIGHDGKALTPLYNYLKPYPEALLDAFYHNYGGSVSFAAATASPVLGSLNSGMQLYRLKHEQPQVFAAVRYALHLPQYLSYLITGQCCTDITSIGCHTNLWHFEKHAYHDWVVQEDVLVKLAPLQSYDAVVQSSMAGHSFASGIGLHDSSAALIPYLLMFTKPFVLISSGTWCISLNPFNDTPLTPEQLQQDCLCYLQFNGKPVKASRLFAGQMHEDGLSFITAFFHTSPDKYEHMHFDSQLLAENAANGIVDFDADHLALFNSDAHAYHALINSLIKLQVQSSALVLEGQAVQQLFVDGGFSRNSIFMHLLAAAFPHLQVYAASMAQATALGAALSLHKVWNNGSIPENLINLQHYPNQLHAVH